MIAKVIAHGATREQALARLRGALRHTAVLGVRSNIAFLRDLLDDERVRDGPDRHRADRAHPGGRRGGRCEACGARRADRTGVRRPPRPGNDDTFARLAGWRLAGAAAPVRDRSTVDGEVEVELALPALGPPGAPAVSALVGDETVSVALLAEATGRGWTLPESRL